MHACLMIVVVTYRAHGRRFWYELKKRRYRKEKKKRERDDDNKRVEVVVS